ncbi:MAG: LCP family protein [Candidatus Doudnabacteria bacterium]|nr:LCP family protein [Candidatus Doudnabacteria bacterium]
MADSHNRSHFVDGVRQAPHISVHFGPPAPSNKPPLGQPKPKKRRWLKIFSAIILTVAVVIGVLFVFASTWSSSSFVGAQQSILGNARDILFRAGNSDVHISGEETGYVNTLLLGIGGEGHDGPYLTDTIIVARLKLDTKEVSLVSIPRDYQVKLPGFGYRKINAAFAEGFNKHKDWNEAGSLARQMVSDITGLSIPYFAVLDFSGFEKAIDEIGGVDVHVERTFTDYQYPNNGTGFLPPQTFTAGDQHFNGAQALIFSRSRHAAGPEGSDFARSQRQQKIIQAARAKVQKLNILTDSGTITKLLQTFTSHFHTNFSPGQLFRLARIAQGITSNQISSSSLDPNTGIICPFIEPESKAYVLVPCPGKTAEDVKDYFNNSFSIGKLAQEKSVIWIATTDPKGSRYKRVAANLEQAGLTVWAITYPDLEPDQTVLYQVNQKPETANYIKNTLKAREVSLAPPNIRIDAARSDIVLILGNNLPARFTAPLPATTQPTATPAATGTTTTPLQLDN